ncbi:hypothetical protein ES703_84766 [subsurface metagenome]
MATMDSYVRRCAPVGRGATVVPMALIGIWSGTKRVLTRLKRDTSVETCRLCRVSSRDTEALLRLVVRSRLMG